MVKVLPKDDLAALIDGGLKRARSHDLHWESSLNAFIVLMFTVAPNFDEDPKVQGIMGDNGMRPDLRMRHLTKVLTPHDWESIRESYDPKVWEQFMKGA